MKSLFTWVLFATVAAMATDTIEKVFEVDDVPHFELSNVAGDIQIIRGEDGQVRVEAKNPNPKIKVLFEQDGNRITVETKYPKHTKNIRGGVDFKVWLPQQSQLVINTVSGEIDLDSVEGRLDMNSVSGDISLKNTLGKIELNCVSGNILARNLGESDLDAQTVSGDIEMSQVMLGSGSYDFNTVSGDVQLWHDEDASYTVSGESLSGDMDIRGIEGLRVKKAKYVGSRSLSGSYNGGRADIDFSSVSGDFTIGLN